MRSSRPGSASPGETIIAGLLKRCMPSGYVQPLFLRHTQPLRVRYYGSRLAVPDVPLGMGAPDEDVLRHFRQRADLALSDEELAVGVRERPAGVARRPARKRIAAMDRRPFG